MENIPLGKMNLVLQINSTHCLNTGNSIDVSGEAFFDGLLEILIDAHEIFFNHFVS